MTRGIPTSCYLGQELWQEFWGTAGKRSTVGERGRWLVVERGQLQMGWVPLLLILVLPLLFASSRILSTVLCTYMGGAAWGGALQVYYYGRRSGRYLYCLCADHWLNRITNSGKHCRQTPLCFPSRRSRWASIQDRKQNFRDD